ncbi:hypothetical protein ACFPES_11925 [Paenibacillus sp. GCM10023248]|uniref:hypothetical protein n=1 Tax=Bacillales TaxID=1385 RepID=UPI0023796AF3|nr:MULTISPECIES: hypothetical protein [Bacillales]MDD9267734.1 hypothetical protein [Paenibacillus sp. MAHUQ-63]MDR6882194.1 hypothetical protein [Bacillus sp. 3255]
MNPTNVILTDADMYLCMLFQTPVEVWFDDEMEDAGTCIEAYSEDVIKVGGVYYLRKLCLIKKAA